MSHVHAVKQPLGQTLLRPVLCALIGVAMALAACSAFAAPYQIVGGGVFLYQGTFTDVGDAAELLNTVAILSGY